MKSTRKRNLWHFGMKVHVSADAKVGLVYVPVLISANAHDKDALPDLLRRDKARAYGDRGYHGYTERFKEAAQQAKNFTNRLPWGEDGLARSKSQVKNRNRARAAQVFLVLKRQFGFGKVRYLGMAKTANRVFTSMVLVNLVMALQRMPRLVRL